MAIRNRLEDDMPLTNEWIVYTDTCIENCRVPSVNTAKKLVRELKARGFSSAYYMSLKEKLGYV
jgi:hypothetical protein